MALTQRTKTLVALVTLLSFTQSACYSTYFISKSELEKLEASVEPQEVVEVYGDCPTAETASVHVAHGTLWAQAEAPAEAADAEHAADVPAENTETTATDAVPAPAAETPEGEANATPPGCDLVKVSTANALYIVKSDGEKLRVTPFNFIMSQQQLVSAEYDILERLDDVDGAEVDEFSTWKTVGTIAGVSVIAIGTFVGISLAAPDSSGFK